MLDNVGALGALCLVLILGLAFPISALLAARRGRGSDEAEMYGRFFQRVRNPWKPEDDQLSELSKRVDELKENQLEEK